MKKILLLMVTVLFFSTTFAYQPTKQDEGLVNVINSSFSKELNKDSTKAAQYANTLDALSIMYLVKDSSGRFSYIFDAVSTYIKTNILKINTQTTIQQTPEKIMIDIPTTLRGHGTDMTKKFYMLAGLYRFHSTHLGEGNFIVHLLDEKGDITAYIANQIGDSEETQSIKIEKDGNYFIEVDADGDRIVDISKNDLKSANTDPQLPGVLNGQNTTSTELFFLKAGLYKVNALYHGESNFIIHVLNDKGDTINYLINEIGETNESQSLKIEKDGYYLLNIEADGGKRTIDMSKM